MFTGYLHIQLQEQKKVDQSRTAEMFENRWCIISPPKDCAEEPVKSLKAFGKQ